MSKKVLIVEDDPGISLSLKDEFESLGYTVIKTDNGKKGLTFARQESPDLIILDIMLPGMEGYDVCRELRNEGNRTPIIMLTSKSKEIDKVLGLELGADDYVTKPFGLRELMARVRSVLRRTAPPAEEKGAVSVSGLKMDRGGMTAAFKGRPLRFQPMEFELLYMLSNSPGRVFSRACLMEKLSPSPVETSARSVDAHIKNIRRKLGPGAKLIETVPRLGYRFKK